MKKEIDLRPDVFEVEDQGNLGSCTANAGLSLLELMYKRIGKPRDFSRLFLYYYERHDNGLSGDTGALPVWITQVLQKRGVCLESNWPYDPQLLDIKPTDACDQEALLYKINGAGIYNLGASSATVENIITTIKQEIQAGRPVLQTSSVPKSFMSLTGPWKEQHFDIVFSEINPLMGSHETLIIGYDDVAQMLLCQNSWGFGWGDGGFFGVPYSYMGSAWLTQLWFVTDAGIPAIYVPNDNQELMQKLYIAYFARPADKGGLDYWVSQLNAGVSINTIAQAFSASPESQSLFANLPIETLITGIYQYAFNRNPDPQGFVYWSNMVSSGQIDLAGAAHHILVNAVGRDLAVLNAKVHAANWFTQQGTQTDPTKIRHWLQPIGDYQSAQIAIENPP